MAAHQTSPKIIQKKPKGSFTNYTSFFKGPTSIVVISTILLIFFIFWIITTILPITLVESQYRLKKVLSNTFGSSDIRAVLIPSFEGLNLYGSSDYKEYGITIPTVFIDEPVIFNVDPNDKKAYTTALSKGIAHASSTSFPDNGGVGYYFAHSSSPELRTQYNAVFYLLGKLEVDDPIFIWHEGKKNKYLVTSTAVTDPKDVSFIQQEYDKETIVLQTCWPPGTTKQRLLVFGERVD